MLIPPIVLSTWKFGLQANAEAWKILNTGGRALDAVEQGVRRAEADPGVRSVGLGGRPDRDGMVSLDACIMDDKGNCGAVGALEHIKHPVSVARRVMEKTPHIFLVGEGALHFALAEGFQKEKLLTPESEKEWREWLVKMNYQPAGNIENHDTIGMIALDSAGNLAGACTTSGLAFKMHGRVGDSPIIGAGLFVDNETGAATATGVGEEAMRICASHLMVERMRYGATPQQACEEAIDRVVRKDPERAAHIQLGVLALNKKGEFGAASLIKGFTYAVYSREDGNLLQEGKNRF